MYTNTKQQISTMQDHNYFCTNPNTSWKGSLGICFGLRGLWKKLPSLCEHYQQRRLEPHSWARWGCCSVTQLYLTLCDPMDYRTPDFPVLHYLPEFAQTHVHWVGSAIQPSHSLSSLSPPAFNLSQHQGLCQWVSSLHQVAKVLELQFQHQPFQWTPRTDLL